MFLDSETCFWILGSVLDSGKCFGFWDVFLDSGKCFGFWEVFLDSGTCFWILGSVSSLRATVDRQSRSTFQRTVFFKQVSLMEFHFFRDQRQWSRLLLLFFFFFSKPSSSVLEPAYLFWLILNMCHLSNASLSLADTFICTHFCHWIRNAKKRVKISFIFRHHFPVCHLNVLVSG